MLLTHVSACKQRTFNSKTNSTIMTYFTVFSTICCISITNRCFLKLLCGCPKEKTFPELSADLSRHTLGAKLSLFSFHSVFFSLFLRAHVLYTVGPGSWMGPSVRPLLIVWPLICLDSVTNRGCEENRSQRRPSQSWGNWAQFNTIQRGR